jgi:hypothetical protein
VDGNQLASLQNQIADLKDQLAKSGITVQMMDSNYADAKMLDQEFVPLGGTLKMYRAPYTINPVANARR